MKENESNRNLLDENDYDVYHCYQKLSDAVTAYEIDTITKYNIKNKSTGFEEDIDLHSYISTIRTEKDIQRFWHNNYKDDCTPIKFNGIPFALLNKRRYICNQGKDINVKNKKRRKNDRQQKSLSNDHSVFKTRKSNQPSKKMNCPAQFAVKKLLYFPGYEISKSSSQWKQDEKKKSLKKQLMSLKNSRIPNEEEDDVDVDVVVST